MDLLIVADLFVVGLALDLAGAFLLSRGLLAAYPTLTRRAGTYWNGNPHVAVGLAEDRIDGRFGVTYLALGFGLQVVGYVLDLAFNPGAEAWAGGHSSRSGSPRLLSLARGCSGGGSAESC
jgi:hypothetical protein